MGGDLSCGRPTLTSTVIDAGGLIESSSRLVRYGVTSWAVLIAGLRRGSLVSTGYARRGRSRSTIAHCIASSAGGCPVQRNDAHFGLRNAVLRRHRGWRRPASSSR
jgi:hypothetical protein